jgi:hypothetical protein
MPPCFFKGIGTLRRYANSEVAFVGSSSGVGRAFAAAAPSPPSQEAPEDCILGENEQSEKETSNPNIDDFQNGSQQKERSRQDWPSSLNVNSFPDYSTAKQLAKTYFQTWHPLLPFLHGPSFMRELEALYSQPYHKPIQPRAERVLRCIFNIVILDRLFHHRCLDACTLPAPRNPAPLLLRPGSTSALVLLTLLTLLTAPWRSQDLSHFNEGPEIRPGVPKM